MYSLNRISETSRLFHQLAKEDVALEELQATISGTGGYVQASRGPTAAGFVGPADDIAHEKALGPSTAVILAVKGIKIKKNAPASLAEYGSNHDRTAILNQTTSAALQCKFAVLSSKSLKRIGLFRKANYPNK